MSISVIVGGNNHEVPEQGESGWGPETTSLLVDLSNLKLDFPLLQDLDLGSSYGVLSIFFSSRAADVADGGQVRLGNQETVTWRNNADNGNLDLTVGVDDKLYYNGSAIEPITDHDLLSNNGGAGSHVAIQSHMDDGSIHFAEGSISHLNIADIGSNSHDDIDVHLASTTNPHATSVDNLSDTTIVGAAFGEVLTWTGAEWENQPSTSGTTFLGLSDTPVSYAGSENYTVKVNATADGLEFISASSAGTTTAPYRFSTSIAGDPGSGQVGVNNADITLATELNISQLDNDSIDRSGGLSALNTNDLMGLNDVNSTTFYTYSILAPGVDNGTYWTFQVEYFNSVGAFIDNELLSAEMVLIPAKNWINLLDTPNDYAGQAGKYSKVNLTEDGIEVLDLTIIDDVAPSLGGNLTVPDVAILFDDSLDDEQGQITLNSSDHLAMGRTTGGIYDPNDGGVVCAPGTLEIHGGSTEIVNLSGHGDQQVFVSDDGVLYGVDAADTGFEVVDTDNGDYSMPTLATWVKMTGLEVALPEDIAVGRPLTVKSNVHVVNNSANQGGSIDIGYGINSAQPLGSGVNYTIAGGYDNIIPTSITSTTHGGLTAGDTITVWVRRSTEDNVQFDPEAHGSGGGTHELIVTDSYGSGGVTEHHHLSGLDADDHTQYSLADGTRAFTGAVGGITPSATTDLATKQYVDEQLLTFNDQTGTSYTLVLTDADNKWINMDNAAANTLTVPPNSSVAFPVGSQINVEQCAAGQTTIAAGAGVTINTPATLSLRAQYSAITLVKKGTDIWTVIGDLET